MTSNNNEDSDDDSDDDTDTTMVYRTERYVVYWVDDQVYEIKNTDIPPSSQNTNIRSSTIVTTVIVTTASPMYIYPRHNSIIKIGFQESIF